MKFRPILRFPIAVFAATIMMSGLFAADNTQIAADNTQTPVDTYLAKDGTTFFALGIQAPNPPEHKAAYDVAIIVETSTTQTGDYQKAAFDTLNATIAALPDGTRVRLFQMDVDATSLTEGFVGKDLPALKEAILELEKVTPLGATDLITGLQAAANSFDEESEAIPVMLYFGSGRSDAKFLDMEEAASLFHDLQIRQIPLNIYAIGEGVNYPTVGMLACQSGGVVVDAVAEHPVPALVAAITGTVYWPESVETAFPANAEVYPLAIPPIRSDRETILIGKADATLDPFGLQLVINSRIKTNDGELICADVTWNCVPSAPNEFNAYLTQVVKNVSQDGGCSFIAAGRHWLEAIKNAAIEEDLNTAKLANQAAQAGETSEANAIASTVSVPASVPAASVPAASSSSLLDRAEVEAVSSEPAFVDRVAQSKSLVDTQITKEISHTLNVAQKMMNTDPEGALSMLRLSIQQIGQETSLTPEKRHSLLNRLENSAKEASRQAYLADVKRQQAREKYFAGVERTAINETLQKQSDRIAAIMRRYTALMAAKDYVNAGVLAQSIRDEARRVGDSAPAVAAQMARWTNTLDLYETYKVQRDVGIVDNIINLHRTNVPISDDYVLTYPDPEVWTLLSEVRKERYKSFDLSSQSESEKKISNSFSEMATLEVVETPLTEILDRWAEDYGINILVDTISLEEEGISADVATTVNVSGIKFLNLLKLVLSQHNLAYCIKDEVLLITTQAVADEYLVTRVYPVGDLVIEIPAAPAASLSGGGGMGGNSGSSGMGGMGGSSGMGGMSGGSGRGGMGGGGSWNVPSVYKDLIRQGMLNRGAILQRPLDREVTDQRMFNVIDEIPSKEDKTTVNTSTRDRETEKLIQNNIRSMTGNNIDIHNPEALWNAVFTKCEPTDVVVKYATDLLMVKRNFREVASIVYRAIQTNRVQPWMSMLLPMALEADGATVAELERAILSIAPYQVSPMERLSLGATLERVGAKKRAMQFYHEVARLAPEKAEPYLYAVRLAEELNDDYAKKWVTLGIASQEWYGEYVNTVLERGENIYAGLLEKMRAEGRDQEADEYEAAMKQARTRDCAIELQYVGDADVELMVKEPAETICWFQQPRTTSGGILRNITSDGETEAAKKVKVYVCSEGFSGKYEVLAKKYWGTVPSGKVKIRVITHMGTENEASQEQYLPLNEELGAVKVVFELKDGRRSGSLDEAIVENAIKDQKKVRDVNLLAKKISMESSNSVLADTISANDDSSSGNNPWNWLPPPGAVGYEPQITTVPTGAAIGAGSPLVAVVSADRRYVRLTPNPMFRQIVDVFTYNTMSGTSTSSGSSGRNGSFSNSNNSSSSNNNNTSN